MKKTERLFRIIDRLRGHKLAVTGDQLALEMGVSVRTIYRDMKTLESQSIPVEGRGRHWLYARYQGLTHRRWPLTATSLMPSPLACDWSDDEADPILTRGRFVCTRKNPLARPISATKRWTPQYLHLILAAMNICI